VKYISRLRSVAYALLLFGFPMLASAVNQTPQAWTTNVAAGVFPNREAALAAVRAMGGVYAMADRLERLSQTPTTTSYTYGATPRAPQVSEWGSFTVPYALTNPHDSEQAGVDSALAWADQNAPGCGGGSISTYRDWYPWKYVFGVESESTKFYDLTFPRLPGCTKGTVRIQAFRKRSVACPSGLVWSGASSQCESPGIAVLTTRPFPCSTCDLVHNPVDVNTGGKYEAETDISLPWISFTRHYHSTHDLPWSPMGIGWTHSLNLSIDASGSSGAAGMVSESGATVPFQSFEATDGSGWTYKYLAEGYRFESPEATYLFAQQRISRITRRDGSVVRLAYDSLGRLSTATHSSGRALVFQYDPLSLPSIARLQSINSAGIELVRYEYDGAGRLDFVRYPDGSSRRYHYEDTRYPYLTGVTDENGVRFASFTYDINGLVASSEHAGGLYRGTFLYGADGSTTYTDANGSARTYRFDASGAYRKISGLESAEGAGLTTYEPTDVRKRPVQKIDMRGAKTTYAYADSSDSTLGSIRKTTVVEAVGTPSARTVVYTRERTAATLLKEVGSGVETAYTRNTRWQPTSITRRDVVTGALRTTSMSYCEQSAVDAGLCPILGLLLSIDGPRIDVSDLTTYVYYQDDNPGCSGSPQSCIWRKGDLWKVTEAAGHVTETLAYDWAGRAVSTMDADGVITNIEYDPRGRVVARTVRSAN